MEPNTEESGSGGRVRRGWSSGLVCWQICFLSRLNIHIRVVKELGTFLVYGMFKGTVDRGLFPVCNSKVFVALFKRYNNVIPSLAVIKRV